MPAALVIRHAQSSWNADGRWQGQADPELSDLGEEQAHSAAPVLERWGRPDLVVTSDLKRARRTGELLAGDVPLVEVAALREYHVGAWSGLTRAEVASRWPDDLAAFDRGRLPRPPGGELRTDFDRRVADAFRQVATLSAAVTCLLVVTHGGVVRSLARQQGRPEHHIGHLAGYRARIEGAGLVLVDDAWLLDPALEEGRPDSAEADA